MRDLENVLDTAKEEGRKERVLEIAKNLLEARVSVDLLFVLRPRKMYKISISI